MVTDVAAAPRLLPPPYVALQMLAHAAPAIANHGQPMQRAYQAARAAAGQPIQREALQPAEVRAACAAACRR
jgi:hypothetical protein